MKKISLIDQLLLLITGLLAAFQIVSGMEGLGGLSVLSYTVAFGVLLIAGLLQIILGFEVLESPLVIIISTLIPLGISLGLVAEFFPQLAPLYGGFVISGILGVALTRVFRPGRPAVIMLMLVHGISGLLIFGLPILLAILEYTRLGFALVGLGGALIGIGGLLLSFLRTGRPILSQNTILRILPALLLLTTIAFVAGFNLR